MVWVCCILSSRKKKKKLEGGRRKSVGGEECNVKSNERGKPRDEFVLKLRDARRILAKGAWQTVNLLQFPSSSFSGCVALLAFALFHFNFFKF